jgi:hypothetical protein
MLGPIRSHEHLAIDIEASGAAIKPICKQVSAGSVFNTTLSGNGIKIIKHTKAGTHCSCAQ